MKKSKKGTGFLHPKTLLFLFIIISLILLVYYFGFYSSSIYQPAFGCNLGRWTVVWANSNTNEIKIDGSFGPTNSEGGLCYGHNLENPVPISDKDFCNSFFHQGAWNDEFKKCVPTSESWFDNKKIKSTWGKCSISPKGEEFDYSFNFNGVHISGIPSATNTWGLGQKLTCRGGFIIGLKETVQTYYRLKNNACNSISLLPSQKTANDYPTLQECQNKIIPPQPLTDDSQLPPSDQDLISTPSKPFSLWEWLSNLCNKIKGWFYR